MRHPLLLLTAAVVLAGCADDPVAPTAANAALATDPGETTAATALEITRISAVTGRTYRVASSGVAAGRTYYTDRNYALRATIPAELSGAVFIQTPNDDKNAKPGATSFLKFTVNQAATVYVLHDSRIPQPSWLTSQYTDTKLAVNTDDAPFRVYRRAVGAGEVTLGSNVASAVGGSMYLVVVKPSTTTTISARPDVSLTAPASGSTVSGTTAITASVTGSGIAGVQFRVNGTAVGSEDTTAPYSTSWNTAGLANGTYTVMAVARNAAGRDSVTRTVTVSNATSAPTVTGGYHVSPSGSATGDGTASRPWNLATALGHPSKVVAGDTIWLRGGTYRGAYTSRLTGTSTKPIVVRQYPGERATLDGNLVVNGAHTWYWGFEVTSTTTSPIDLMAVNVAGPGTKFINMVVHDAGGNGFGVWTPAVNAEVYGSIVYNNGRQRLDGAYAHGIYAQNATGTQRFVDNIVFNQFAYGLHMYAESGSLQGFHLEGNVSFENGRSSSGRGSPEILVGGGTPADRVSLVANMTYKSSQDGTNTQIGYNGTQNRAVSMRDNYIAGGKPALRMLNWASATVTGNTFAQAAPWEMIWITGSTSGYSWTDNTHWRGAGDGTAWYVAPNAYALSGFNSRLRGTDRSAGSAPTGTKVFVRPNQYERGRANVVVYNWAKSGSVSANLAGVLSAGDAYEVRNVRDLFGAPVATGTFGGGTITIPMTAVPSPRPVGGWIGSAPPSTSEFQTFVVTKRGS